MKFSSADAYIKAQRLLSTPHRGDMASWLEAMNRDHQWRLLKHVVKGGDIHDIDALRGGAWKYNFLRDVFVEAAGQGRLDLVKHLEHDPAVARAFPKALQWAAMIPTPTRQEVVVYLAEKLAEKKGNFGPAMEGALTALGVATDENVPKARATLRHLCQYAHIERVYHALAKHDPNQKRTVFFGRLEEALKDFMQDPEFVAWQNALPRVRSKDWRARLEREAHGGLALIDQMELQVSTPQSISVRPRRSL